MLCELDRAGIAALIPQQGTMCLLHGVRSWSAAGIVCTARSHLDPANPLRRNGVLSVLCGCEYAFQAAALHGALAAGGVRQAAGYVAALHVAELGADRLDDPALGETITVEARLELADPAGLIYGLTLRSTAGAVLLDGRGTIVLPG